MILLAGCGSKKETNVNAEDKVSQQDQVSEPAAVTEEVSKVTPEEEMTEETVESEEVINQEASKGEDIDYLQLHGITLDRIYSWVMDGTKEAHIADGEQVIVDTIKKLGDYAHYDMGFAIEEVNEDGIPDLVIGQPSQEGKGNMIYAIYTWKDGNFQCNAEGAEYVQVFPGCVNEAQVIYFTPFAYYEPGIKLESNINTPSTEGPAVAAVWLEDVYLEPNGYDVVTADDLPEQRQIVFIAMSEVKDFKILVLTVGAMDENGITYEAEEVHSQAVLTSDRPLMVGMSCDSTMSRYGFSYVDANGNTVNWEIHVSGVDGSITVSEF